MAIKIHDLQPAPGSKRDKIRVGRGEGSKGKTAGRGMKGTRARKTVSPRFEGGQMPLQMRLPKLRGFKNRNRVEYQGINIRTLAETFPQGGTIGLTELVSSGLVKKNERVKILGDGDLGNIKVDVTAHAFSGSAQEKITAAGGSATKVAR